MKKYISKTIAEGEPDFILDAVRLEKKREVPFVEGAEWQEAPDGFPMIKVGQGTFCTMKKGDYITVNSFGRIGVARRKAFEADYVPVGK